MKTIKKLSLILVLEMLFAITSSSVNAVEYYGPKGVGAHVECSSGNHGTCFIYVCVWCNYDDIFSQECKYTGNQTNSCSLFVVKLCNFVNPLSHI